MAKCRFKFKKRIQGIITPEGFVFDSDLIKPTILPHFIRIFGKENGIYKIMGPILTDFLNHYIKPHISIPVPNILIQYCLASAKRAVLGTDMTSYAKI